MNPVIVIPSYWTDGADKKDPRAPGAYDYATPVTKPLPELENCLSSLENVRGVLRVIVLVVAPHSCEDSARARVNSICRSHPALNAMAIGSLEGECVVRQIARISGKGGGDTTSMRGYGAIRNMGLALACIFGHDSIVFMDDDEVALSPDFLIDAIYGLGAYTRQDLRILAKSGYYVRPDGSPYAKVDTSWSERHWTKHESFNDLMRRYLTAPTRIVRSNYLCGGCCALHAAAFTKVPFDPYITRGEDLDYLLNLRYHGLDVWFDNVLSVRMQPPEEMAPTPSIFMQDVYRWFYEYRKLEFMNTRRELRQVTPESLMPYPGPWLSSRARSNVRSTAFRRFLATDEHGEYFSILTRGIGSADAYAKANASRYLSFAASWEDVAAGLWDDRYLQSEILKSASVALRRSNA
ncbi:MAG: glycosyltransferase family 2 protein [Tractidigestivibacter sp.]|jgi:hypothetical protein|uniref:glycosyltransferase family 2 protein n=1 Tax=Tractidigestivibacter sp. TaxID=2847320 RepID=UPI003D8B9B75